MTLAEGKTSYAAIAEDKPMPAEKSVAAQRWSPSLRIVRDSICAALEAHARDHQVGSDGPRVRAVPLERVRTEFGRLYIHTGDADRRSEAERKAFRRAVDSGRAKNLIGSETISDPKSPFPAAASENEDRVGER